MVYVNGIAGTGGGNYTFSAGNQNYPSDIGLYPFYFGNCNQTSVGWSTFYGYIAHLRVYSRNLTAAEIMTLYTNKC